MRNRMRLTWDCMLLWCNFSGFLSQTSKQHRASVSLWLATQCVGNQSINQTSIAPISPAKRGSVAHTKWTKWLDNHSQRQFLMQQYWHKENEGGDCMESNVNLDNLINTINQTSIEPISPAKPDSVARQPNKCPTANRGNNCIQICQIFKYVNTLLFWRSAAWSVLHYINTQLQCSCVSYYSVVVW